MIKCLTCPMCDQAPSMVLNLEQAFCGNEECPAFCWDMTKTMAWNRCNITVHDLDGLFSPRAEPGS